MTEETYRAAEALQAKLGLDLEGEERQSAINDWARCRQRYRYGRSLAHTIIEEARGERSTGDDRSSSGRAGNGKLPEIIINL
ncbi:hypothetical protein T12_2269 [Trichinella patagoniensis]|uniref:Uncharacterized protein n=1 Tax=Trichinella patagoniensis TaxID=990121 RepID=A0A0V1AEL1_9BILA|nr:hypothetical protein T12_2269 [Trichinella patagoniensis]